MPQIYTVGRQPEDIAPDQPLEVTGFWQQVFASSELPLQKTDAFLEDRAERQRESDGSHRLAVENHAGCRLRTVLDLYQEPLLEDVRSCFSKTRIRSLLVISLRYGNLPLGYLTLFRDEIDTNILWAGRFDPDERNQPVRESFTAWQELKHGQAQPRTASEMELVRSLGTHLTMAIMQNRFYRCEREQRLLVERDEGLKS